MSVKSSEICCAAHINSIFLRYEDISRCPWRLTVIHDSLSDKTLNNLLLKFLLLGGVKTDRNCHWIGSRDEVYTMLEPFDTSYYFENTAMLPKKCTNSFLYIDTIVELGEIHAPDVLIGNLVFYSGRYLLILRLRGR